MVTAMFGITVVNFQIVFSETWLHGHKRFNVIRSPCCPLAIVLDFQAGPVEISQCKQIVCFIQVLADEGLLHFQ
jgi:hypothetical protein